MDTASTPSVQYVYDDGATGGEAKYVRLTDVVYPNGRDVKYGYGTTGAIDDIMSRLATIGDGTTTQAAYKYLGAGTIVEEDYVEAQTKLTYLNASGNPTGFDRFGRVVDQLWADDSGTPIDEYKYGYDRAGNRQWKQNAAAVGKALDELYSYDQLDQLINTQRGTLDFSDPDTPTIMGETKYQSWTLDGLGNWTESTADGTTETRTTNAANEITSTNGSVSPAYDRAGNMTTIPSSPLLSGEGQGVRALGAIYDAWNRLVRVADGSNTLAEYEYDGSNRRITESTYTDGVLSEVRHDYLNQQNQVLEERVISSPLPPGEGQGEGADPAASAVQYQNLWSPRYVDSLILRDTYSGGIIQPASRLFYLADANYNVTGLVKQVETEGVTEWQVVERYAYSAYGNATIYTPAWSTTRDASSFNNTTLYTGRKLDLATGLYYYRARYYNADLGVFVGRDPIMADQSLYRYCRNRPTYMVDPTGCASAVLENVAGLELLGLWAIRGMRVTMLGPAAIPVNQMENALWNMTGVPVLGLTYTVKTNVHVASAVQATSHRIQTILAAQEVGNYADKGKMTIVFAPESTALEWILSTSALSYSYQASVRLDTKGCKHLQGAIKWKFYDEIDANSFSETYHKGGFGTNVPLITKIINFIEGEADIAFDKLGSANYDLNLTWTTELSDP